MDLGTVLVLFGVLIAALSFFIPDLHRLRAVAAAVLCVGVGVLIGAAPFITT
jgi:hypothetical protein